MNELQQLRDEITQLNTALTIKNGTIAQLKARNAQLEDRNAALAVQVEARQVPEDARMRAAAEMNRLGYGYHESHAASILIAAAPAQPAAQREWPDDEIVAAWKWCEENGGTPAEFLSHSLLVKRSRVLGRPLTWREAIELTAITTNMPDEERDKLLAIDDEPDAAAQDQGEVQRLREALEWAVDRWHAEVASRPLVNVHRRALDGTWRQIIRRLGGDAGLLCGPAHDELLALAASTGQEVKP